MRIIRKQKVLTTIFDKDINDAETIIIALTNFINQHIEFFLSIRQPRSDGYYTIINYEKVRVKSIGSDGKVDFVVVGTNATTFLRNISFNNIETIEAITSKNNILESFEEPTRWDFLDI